MDILVNALLPEIILCSVACVLFLMGVSRKPAMRRAAGMLALVAMVVVFGIQLYTMREASGTPLPLVDDWGTVRIYNFAQFIKLLAAGVGAMLVLLNMPTNVAATGGSASDFGDETGEYFGLLLLSIAGMFLVASANDIILLFLGIELASIPTYIMVSISRPIPVAQEAGVKYFFLGAMSAAVMLLGFSYLYGVTGSTSLAEIAKAFEHTARASSEWSAASLTEWQLVAVLMLIAGFAFKMAAVPLHVYAGDVYQGSATPLTAFLAFVPKTAGFVALIKLMYAISGNSWMVPETVAKLIWVLAALTMTVGNVLGLLQFNIKRVLAYSSVAHTGYMLVGVAALISTADHNIQTEALSGVLFYLVAYGIMNTAAFGVLMLLPSRLNHPATSAETFEDLAGQGRKHVGLGLVMAVACFSLTGLPLTVGFFGKLYLIKPALHAGLNGLVIVLVINAAISAAYYLRIVAAMFLRPEPTHPAHGGPALDAPSRLAHPTPVLVAVGLSVIGTLGFGVFFPATGDLVERTNKATLLELPESGAGPAHPEMPTASASAGPVH
jgi:NADH-quinone oxidoreductase subunit N